MERDHRPRRQSLSHVLGLTTQVPIQPIYLTSGRDRKLRLGEQTVLLRHAPAWQLVAPGRPSGDAIRALAWLGPAAVAANIGVAKQKLTNEDLQELAASRARMPAWLTESVSDLVANA